MTDRDDFERHDFKAEREDERPGEGLNLKRPDGTIASGFDAQGGREDATGASGASSPAGFPPDEARRQGEAPYDGNPSLDPAGISQETTGGAADPVDQPPTDDGYIERPAGRDPVEGAALDLEDQIRSEHA